MLTLENKEGFGLPGGRWFKSSPRDQNFQASRLSAGLFFLYPAIVS